MGNLSLVFPRSKCLKGIFLLIFVHVCYPYCYDVFVMGAEGTEVGLTKRDLKKTKGDRSRGH